MKPKGTSLVSFNSIQKACPLLPTRKVALKVVCVVGEANGGPREARRLMSTEAVRNKSGCQTGVSGSAIELSLSVNEKLARDRLLLSRRPASSAPATEEAVELRNAGQESLLIHSTRIVSWDARLHLVLQFLSL